MDTKEKPDRSRGMEFIIWWEMFSRKWIPFGRRFNLDLYATIGDYFHDKYMPDRKQIERTINMMEITRVWYRCGYVYIESKHPGLLIGKCGADLDDMTAYFKSHWRHGFPLRGIKIKTLKYDPHRYLFLWQYRYSDWDG